MRKLLNMKKLWKRIKKNYRFLIPLAFSFLALIVAFITYIATDRGTTVSINQGMPFLQIVDVKLTEPVNKTSFITLDLTIKNVGGGQQLMLM